MGYGYSSGVCENRYKRLISTKLLVIASRLPPLRVNERRGRSTPQFHMGMKQNLLSWKSVALVITIVIWVIWVIIRVAAFLFLLILHMKHLLTRVHLSFKRSQPSRHLHLLFLCHLSFLFFDLVRINLFELYGLKLFGKGKLGLLWDVHGWLCLDCFVRWWTWWSSSWGRWAPRTSYRWCSRSASRRGRSTDSTRPCLCHLCYCSQLAYKALFSIASHRLLSI